MKIWNLSTGNSPVEHLENSEGDSYEYGKNMSNLIFYMKYYEETPIRNQFVDIISSSSIHRGFLITPSLKEILDDFRIQELGAYFPCTVSNGLEEKDYFLLYVHYHSLKSLDNIVDFNRSEFYLSPLLSDEIICEFEAGYIRNGADFSAKSKEEKAKKDFYGTSVSLRIGKLVFKEALDYFFAPGGGPFVSDRLKNTIEANKITGIVFQREFKMYNIEMPQIK